ncbi:MAG: hypothetical protein ABL986_06210 [Vicinamibacterales bacterium]
MTIRTFGRLTFGIGACAAWLLASGLADLAAQGQQAPAAPVGQQAPGRQGGPAPNPGGGARAGGGGQRGGGQGRGAAPATAQAAAPTDFTGTWVSIITEDWRFRMVTPPKGDAASIPANQAAIQASENWDPAKDIAAGEQCKAFGAPGIMRMPTRIRISWQDPQTLKLEFDNGTQTRLFHFAANTPAPAQPDWQGHSIARWETMQESQGQPAAGGRGGGAPALSGGLRVATRQLRSGYMRRNGIPYSANAVYNEVFDVAPGPQNETWLIITSELIDPQFLNQPYMLSTQFKKEPDASKFSPRPCELTPPVTGAADAR